MAPKFSSILGLGPGSDLDTARPGKLDVNFGFGACDSVFEMHVSGLDSQTLMFLGFQNTWPRFSTARTGLTALVRCDIFVYNADTCWHRC